MEQREGVGIGSPQSQGFSLDNAQGMNPANSSCSYLHFWVFMYTTSYLAAILVRDIKDENCSSMIQYLFPMDETLNLFPTTKEKQNRRKEKR